MKAKVTVAFNGRPDGEPLAQRIEVGAIISGELATVALREQWAEDFVEPVEVVAEPNPLDDLTVEQLKAFAAEKSIDLGEATKKADIRAAIDKAIEATPAV